MLFVQLLKNTERTFAEEKNNSGSTLPGHSISSIRCPVTSGKHVHSDNKRDASWISGF